MMTKKPDFNMITVLGHTAAGKTSFAAHLAFLTKGEIISADSRQVYRGMDLGTGKDYSDYVVGGSRIPYHLIDIVNPGYEYNVYEYQRDFLKAYHDITSRNKLPFLCGGTGLYLEAAMNGYRLINVPVNPGLRNQMETMSMEELKKWLASFKNLHNTTDTINRKRITRAIEIEVYNRDHEMESFDYPDLNPIILGIRFDRETRRKRITTRLQERLDAGMAEEVRNLIDSGISPERLAFYGLEYKYLSWYVTGKIGYEDMFQQLNTAIHRFAKRQMTWFRKMERAGTTIHWIDGDSPLEDKIGILVEIIGYDL